MFVLRDNKWVDFSLIFLIYLVFIGAKTLKPATVFPCGFLNGLRLPLYQVKSILTYPAFADNLFNIFFSDVGACSQHALSKRL